MSILVSTYLYTKGKLFYLLEVVCNREIRLLLVIYCVVDIIEVATAGYGFSCLPLFRKPWPFERGSFHWKSYSLFSIIFISGLFGHEAITSQHKKAIERWCTVFRLGYKRCCETRWSIQDKARGEFRRLAKFSIRFNKLSLGSTCSNYFWLLRI